MAKRLRNILRSYNKVLGDRFKIAKNTFVLFLINFICDVCYPLVSFS